MLPCKGCAYRRDIPGDCHSRCVFAWTFLPEQLPTNVKGGPRTNQWFRFPFNYDPVWGPDTCAARSEVADLERVAKTGPMDDLMSLLGGRF